MPEGVGYGPQNTASVGLNLNVIGNHAYAYSGQFAASTSAQTVLEFTSGNYYFVGEFHLYGAVDSTDPSAGRSVTSGLLSFNGVDLLTLTAGNDAVDTPMDAFCQIVIPPYTEVKGIVDSAANEASRLCSLSLVGRIYGKVDE